LAAELARTKAALEAAGKAHALLGLLSTADQAELKKNAPFVTKKFPFRPAILQTELTPQTNQAD
jgi:hypothetical protein